MTGSKKFCVVHGHFYQPPRESPWFGEIERQPSASPYHDWNERIFDECYRTNAFSRILNNEGQITGVINNYSYMSFNFGPTLFRWLARKKPRVYRRIVGADKRSCDRYNGHGSAVAQAYNHTILPHASREDKLTQIRWSKSFFKRHFGRETEGMWLAETAINNETVECLIEEGIKFVILSPLQADSFSMGLSKREEDAKWISTTETGLDPRYPYRVYAYDKEGERKKGHLDVFFFDEPLSRSISFEGLLDNADILTDRVSLCYDVAPKNNQLVTIATDGETFGHHKNRGDMCLAYFFRKKAEEMGIEVVNFAYYLSVNPPKREVKLKNARGEGTAWSCAHGTGRWIRDCGCNTGGLAGWNQAWRGPFREALNYLNDSINEVYTKEMSLYFKNPQEIRDLFEPYIDSKKGVSDFLRSHSKKRLTDAQIHRVIMLLESQVFMQYAYTSCAWFFNDITGIETVQNICYALRSWQLTWPKLASNHVLDRFRSILAEAKSNIHGQSGATILDQYAMPMVYHMERAAFTAVVNHYVYEDETDYTLDFYNIGISRLQSQMIENGVWQFFEVSVGHASTFEKSDFGLALSNSSGRNITGVVFPLDRLAEVQSKRSLKDVLALPEVVHLTLKDVFKPYCDLLTDRFVSDFARDTLVDYLSWAGQFNSRLDTITELNEGLPPSLAGTVSFFINKEWDINIQQLVKLRFSEVVRGSLDDLVQKATHYNITIDKRNSADLLDTALISAIEGIDLTECCVDTVRQVIERIEVVRKYGIPVKMEQVQDAFYLLYKKVVAHIEEQGGLKGISSNMAPCINSINDLARTLGFSCERTTL